MVNEDKLRKEAVQAVQECPDLTYAEIGKIVGVPAHQVCIWANEAGLFRRKRRVPAAHTTRTNVQPLSPEELDAKIVTLERELSETRQQKAATEIRFERDGNTVIVYGVGAQPLSAHHKDWLRFLRKNGAATLRSFIEDSFGASGLTAAP